MSGNPSRQIVRIDDVPYRDIDDVSLRLDIIRPDPIPIEPMPVLIYLFGGRWMSGDRKQNRNELLPADTGLFTVSIDYRLSHQATFPAQIADARAAVRWLRAHADDYHIDPARIGVWGYSSGGHLAALLGTAPDATALDDGAAANGYSSRVQAVLTLSAPTDFLQAGGYHEDADSPESRLVGGPIRERAELARQANPITYIRGDEPPFLIIHGVQDEAVPVGQSQLLYDALVRAGVDATFMSIAKAGHRWGTATPYGDLVNHIALAFFAKHLHPIREETPHGGIEPL